MKKKKTRNPIKKRREKKRVKAGYESRRTIYANDENATREAAGQVRYPSNYVSTTKYTFYNFFFKNLWEQFHRVANVYFVIQGIITLTPASPVSPGPYIAVIVLVLGVVMVKDCYEDFQRYKQDRETNRRMCQVLRNGVWEQERWENIAVGQILRIERDQQFPADLLLLSSDKPNGQCHVQTANLDGEVSLKVREALPCTREAANLQDLMALRLRIDCQQPSPDLTRFDCTLTVGDSTFGVGVEQLLVRSTVLKNADFCYGIVIYTGNQTKYMQNCAEPRHKISAMERRLNRYIIFIILGLIVLCIISASLGVAFQSNTGDDSWYLKDAVTDSGFVYWISLFFSFFVIYGDVVPIALYVTLEMVRLMQGKHVEVDLAIYDYETGFRTRCMTTTLNEELGQVEYIFSDKTGTLTANKMTLRSCFVGGNTFGDPAIIEQKAAGGASGDFAPTRPRKGTDSLPLIVAAEGGGPPGNAAHPAAPEPEQFGDPRLEELLGRPDAPDFEPVLDFFVCVCLCNTIFPARDDKNELSFEFESPDELALVKGAAGMGIVLESREQGSVVLNVRGQRHTFQVLHILPFDADRKRMSVVVRFPDGNVRLLIKGADSSMLPIMTGGAGRQPAADEEEEEDIDEQAARAAGSPESRAVSDAVNGFANNGLRVLVMGQRTLSAEEYQEWLQEYWEPVVQSFGPAKTENLHQAIQVIERHITPVGASGIEDELQEGVPHTITSLLLAGIKVWVLTGDKMETAINIGYTCQLLEPQAPLLKLRSSAAHHHNKEAATEELGQLISQRLQELQGRNDDNAPGLVINGPDIPLVIGKANRTAFLELAQRCSAVIICRATPRDKRKVVRVVKKHLQPLTLAVGDGANDVPMIQQAHIGVGIRGQEGTQAINNSDYAIGKFRFLEKLLLVHGRWNYKRLSLMILYFFYKNIVVALIPLWWAIETGWSGSAFFDALTRRGYNVIFTAWLIIIMSVLDQDIYAPGLLKYPQLYRECQQDYSFNRKAFIKWCSWGVYDSILIYYFARLSQYGVTSVFDDSGQTGGGDLLSSTCFTSVVLVANVRLAFHCRFWTIFHAVTISLSIALWYALAILLTEVSPTITPDLYGVIARLYGAPSFWLVNIVTVVA